MTAEYEKAMDAQPVAWVAADTLNSPHPVCVSSLAYVSQLDKDQGREYVPLYAAPVAAQGEDDARDAARYRWLRDPLSGAERVIFYCRGDYGKGLMAGSMLDAAIDDAMRNPSFCRRLGLSNTGRTLRQAIDQARGKGG